jgi:hypothetical protein
MRLRTRCLLLLLGCAAVPHAGAQMSSRCAQLSAEQVVQQLVRRNQERAEALPAYRSTRIYRVDYRGFPGARSAEMIVEARFEPPNRKTFVVRSQSGSKLLIDRVFKKLLEGEQEAFAAENQRRTALTPENYTFTLSACENALEAAVYELAVEPKLKSKFLYRGKVWVDGGDFAVVRILAEPAKNPSLWIRQTEIEQIYGRVNEFWLPARNHSATTVRLGGHADFSIEYTDYRFEQSTPATASDRVSQRRP